MIMGIHPHTLVNHVNIVWWSTALHYKTKDAHRIQTVHHRRKSTQQQFMGWSNLHSTLHSCSLKHGQGGLEKHPRWSFTFPLVVLKIKVYNALKLISRWDIIKSWTQNEKLHRHTPHDHCRAKIFSTFIQNTWNNKKNPNHSLAKSSFKQPGHFNFVSM